MVRFEFVVPPCHVQPLFECIVYDILYCALREGVTRILYLSVTERVLSWDERPWDIVKMLGKDSIRQMELMRFYLQLKQDPHGPNLALFVGNLPPNLSERSYENMLTEFLGKGQSIRKLMNKCENVCV